MSPAAILFELTGQLHFALPVLLATIIARQVSTAVCEPYYEQMLRLAQLPVPPASALARMGHVPLGHIMVPPQHALPRRISSGELGRQLERYPEHRYVGAAVRACLRAQPANPSRH